jgi:hypothetical protein
LHAFIDRFRFSPKKEEALDVLLPVSLCSDQVPVAYDVPSAWVQGRPHALNSMEEYRDKYAQSIGDPNAFWRGVASEFEWRGEPLATTGLKYNFDKTKGKVFSEW